MGSMRRAASAQTESGSPKPLPEDQGEQLKAELLESRFTIPPPRYCGITSVRREPMRLVVLLPRTSCLLCRKASRTISLNRCDCKAHHEGNTACAERVPICRLRPGRPKAALARLPQSPALCALRRRRRTPSPYIGRTPNLRARLQRLLQPSAKHPRRLQLAGLVRRVELAAHRLRIRVAARAVFAFGGEVRRKGIGADAPAAPAFVRVLGGNPYPRVTVTFRPGPARGQLGLRAVPFARRRRALRGRDAEAVSVAPLHVRAGSRSQLSGVCLLRDEDVPCAVLQGLHGRALR